MLKSASSSIKGGIGMKGKIFIVLIALFVIGIFSSSRASTQIDWDTVPERTKTALYKAQQEMNENDYPRAIDILMRVEKREKYNHFLIEFNIGTAYALSGQIGRAIDHLEKSAGMEPNYSPTWMNLGKLYYQQENFLQAGSALEKGFRSAPTRDMDILYMAMASYFQGNDLPKTIELGEEIVFEYKGSRDSVVSLLANAYISTKNYDGAIKMLNTLLQRNPNNYKGWKLLCHAYFNNQQYVEATIAYETYGYLHGLDRDDQIVLGDLFFMSGVPIRAAQYYQQALKNGGSPEEFEKLAVYFYSAFEIDGALTSLEESIKGEMTVERLLLKAQLYYLQDDFGKAEQYYVNAAEKMSKDGHEWLMAGYCAMRNGDNKKAKELLHRAMDYPSQRQEAQSILKIMSPAEEMKELMTEYKNSDYNI
jgi:tetratricopeptide (TPR) repeat protein